MERAARASMDPASFWDAMEAIRQRGPMASREARFLAASLLFSVERAVRVAWAAALRRSFWGEERAQEVF